MTRCQCLTLISSFLQRRAAAPLRSCGGKLGRKLLTWCSWDTHSHVSHIQPLHRTRRQHQPNDWGGSRGPWAVGRLNLPIFHKTAAECCFLLSQHGVLIRIIVSWLESDQQWMHHLVERQEPSLDAPNRCEPCAVPLPQHSSALATSVLQLCCT